MLNNNDDKDSNQPLTEEYLCAKLRAQRFWRMKTPAVTLDNIIQLN